MHNYHSKMHRKILHDAKGLLPLHCFALHRPCCCTHFLTVPAGVLRRWAILVGGRARSRTTTLYVLESFETVGLEIHGKLATQARSRIAHPMSRNCFGRTHSSAKHAEGPYLTIGFLLTFIFSVSHQWTEIRAVRALDRDPNDGRDSAH